MENQSNNGSAFKQQNISSKYFLPEQSKQEQEQKLRLLLYIESNGQQNKQLKQLRNKLFHNYFTSTKQNLPFFQYFLKTEIKFKGLFDQILNSENFKEFSKDQNNINSIPYLFFIRLLAICRELAYYNQESRQLFFQKRYDKKYQKNRSFNSDKLDQLFQNQQFRCDKIIDFVQNNQLKERHQLRNKIKYDFKFEMKIQQEIENQIYDNQQSLSDLIKLIFEQVIQKQPERYKNLDQFQEEFIKESDLLDSHHIFFALYTINECKFKIRNNINGQIIKLENIIIEAKKTLDEIPQLLELPQILQMLIKQDNDQGGIFGYKLESLPDVGKLYTDSIEFLRKQHIKNESKSQSQLTGQFIGNEDINQLDGQFSDMNIQGSQQSQSGQIKINCKQ